MVGAAAEAALGRRAEHALRLDCGATPVSSPDTLIHVRLTISHHPVPGDFDLPQAGYDRWAEIYDDDENSLVALEARLLDQLIGDVRGLCVADALMRLQPQAGG